MKQQTISIGIKIMHFYFILFYAREHFSGSERDSKR